MDYNTIYQRICTRGQTRSKSKDVYLERHHVKPKCMGGNNAIINITLLTAREHYIAHHLLCKIHCYSDVSIRVKLASAFNRMCTYNTHERRYTSRQFETARINFSRNHPMKSEEIRTKVSIALKARGLIKKELRQQSLPSCMCGCGEKVKSKYQRYLYNHWDRSITKVGFTEEVRTRLSDKAIKRISCMTEDEKKRRLQNSLHSDKVDHIMRGKHISLAKRGKKTDQLEIMGRRFSNMTDEEFKKYLNTVSYRVWVRYTKLRNKWIYKK